MSSPDGPNHVVIRNYTCNECWHRWTLSYNVISCPMCFGINISYDIVIKMLDSEEYK